MSKREKIIFEIGLIALGIFLGVALSCAVYMRAAEAEDGFVGHCWVICKPTDSHGKQNEVLIREKPGRKAEVVGTVTGGDMLITDWEEKDGWIHIIDLANETGDGWIFEGYIVFTEPRAVWKEMQICANGRVACRKYIGGKRTAWAQDGETVTVYWMTGEYAVTDRGFIQSEYMGGTEE